MGIFPPHHQHGRILFELSSLATCTAWSNLIYALKWYNQLS